MTHIGVMTADTDTLAGFGDDMRTHLPLGGLNLS